MPINPAGALSQYRTQSDANEAAIAVLDTQVSGIVVGETEIFRAVSNVDQSPSGLDTPLQVTFGSGQSTTEFNLDALGELTVLVSGYYTLTLRLVFGRTGNPGTANLYARGLVNGTQSLASIFTKLDDANTSVSSLFTASGYFPASTTFTAEIMRASINSGIDAGGLHAEPSPLAGWLAAPSCSIAITRNNVILGS